ncbi:hypothetical protein [Brachybacterium tyrofermentans]|uniref:hypothetical protein n=1 Tax=Brachybacterium tyrofermentans TaxID=47848 RepID=UPI00186637EA|nr:hypothetical protein [Brachybacterium tyrofermentans]
MTATTPAPLRFARPTVSGIRLRNGEQGVTIIAADQRVIVRQEHLAALIDDLTEHEEDESA